MKRLHSRKSHSWWWDSHISPKNSKWLADNLEEMDKQIKEMLKLIEEEGDSFGKKAEMYYQRRPELISHVENFYRMYRSLAERYDNVTGELRKNIPSKLQHQGSSSGSDFGSELPFSSPLPSPEITPNRTPPRQKQAAGFDFFLGSGGSSDVSGKGSDGSSSCSESESESDDGKEENGDGVTYAFHHKILELEEELRVTKEKLGVLEERNSNASALQAELTATREKLQNSETEIANLGKTVEEMNLSSENSSELHGVDDVVQVQIMASRHEIECLKGAILDVTQKFEANLSRRDHEINIYKGELAVASGRFLREKSALDAEIVKLQVAIENLKANLEQVVQEKSLLEARVSELESVVANLTVLSANNSEKLQEKSALETKVLDLSQANASLEAKISFVVSQIRQLDAEKTEALLESERIISELNHNLASVNTKLETLTSEKEVLMNDLTSRDEQIKQMDGHLHQLHLEHARLITEIESTQRAGAALAVRVKELEEEVERQMVVIADGAEGKREAIRQLCFSLEHYRDGYLQLHRWLQGHRWLLGMAT